MIIMNKYLDIKGLEYFAKRMKEYVDIKVDLAQNKRTNCPNCGAAIKSEVQSYQDFANAIRANAGLYFGLPKNNCLFHMFWASQDSSKQKPILTIFIVFNGRVMEKIPFTILPESEAKLDF